MNAARRAVNLWAAAVASLWLLVEWSIVRSSIFRADGPLPWAVAFDLLLLLPGAYAWFVLRPAGRPLRELTPVLVACVLATDLLLGQVAQLRRPLALLTAAAELTAVTLIARRLLGQVGRVPAAGSGAVPEDLVSRVSALPGRFARVVGLELCVLYYACIAPFRKLQRDPSDESAGTQYFSNGARPRQLLLALGLLSVLEAVPVHLLLHARHPYVAWAALAVSAYGLLWIGGSACAFRLRPVVVSPSHLWIRASLFFSAPIELSEIRSVAHHACHADNEALETMLTIAPLSTPNVWLTLHAPTLVTGPFGRTRTAQAIAVYVDQPDELIALLKRQVQ